ncbi:hypothetical protein [Arabiibacter massiliensis]|uniref:hypothetical protein n=1 Tax=Arabiibacter massiliensis TaxID=1870985 RepID=UPI0009BB5348|nr:hypothetical protein [Arabiibacter massiliensis]
MEYVSKDARRLTDDLFNAWRAVRNVVELDEVGLYPGPLPENTRAMLNRCASELSMAMAEQSARARIGGAL